jgi:RNA polymerase sigma factor (sigma-70 family)
MVMHQTPIVSDEEWMLRLSEGNLDGASQLFERYQVRLYNFFLRLGYERAASEDLTQNVFERMLKYRQSYRNQTAFQSWIFQIARNVSADFYKKNRLHISDFTGAEAIADPDTSISKQIEEAENIDMLHQAMAQLPEDQREILVLTRFQNLKYSEAADVLGCTETNAKVKAHRAIKQLRELYFKIQQS